MNQAFQEQRSWSKRTKKYSPRAMSRLEEDFEASPAHLYRRRRTANLIEGNFGEQRRRSRVIPRFFAEKSALKLAWATLWRSSLKRRRAKFSEIEQKPVLESPEKPSLIPDQTVMDDENNSITLTTCKCRTNCSPSFRPCST